MTQERRDQGETPPTMEPGRALDEVVAFALGVSLEVPRECAMARVAWRYIKATGPMFHLTTGEGIGVPDGETLAQPEGCEHYNDRYALFIAKRLGDRIAAEVDAFRLAPEPYSTSADHAVALAERFRLVLEPLDVGGYRADSNDAIIRDAYGQNIPHAVALWVASYVRAGSPS